MPKVDTIESGDGTNGTDGWVVRARALKPLLEAAAPRIEQFKTIPPDVMDALHGVRLFRMTTPRSVGGAELDLATFAQAVAAIAEGDASTAWCVAQISGSSMASAYLEPSIANEIFGRTDSAFTWGFAGSRPPCRAVPVRGGWIVNGTWNFGSGSRLCQWLGGHTQLCDENGTQLRNDDGSVVERTMLFPRSSALIRDDVWEVIGLAGTGSDSYSVTDLFVPKEYSIVPRAIASDQQLAEGLCAVPDPERREQGVLYRFSSTAVFQIGLSSVAIGVARATLDAFIAVAKSKTPSMSAEPLRENGWVQARIAQADAKISAASAWLEKLLRQAWHECATGGEMSFPLRVKIRTACTHQINEAREAVEMIYLEAGATAIFKNQPFERRLRDIHAVSQQVQGGIARLQTVGQYYLGMKPSLFFLP